MAAASIIAACHVARNGVARWAISKAAMKLIVITRPAGRVKSPSTNRIPQMNCA